MTSFSPDELVVIDDVLLELGPVLGEVFRRAGPGGEDGVHKVGRAAHHAATGPGPPRHHLAPTDQVVGGPGYQEGQPDRVAGGGRGEGHLFSQRRIVLHVVEGGHRAHAVAQRRVGGHVLDPLAVEPHLAGAVLEAGDVFLSGTCWHRSSPHKGNSASAGLLHMTGVPSAKDPPAARGPVSAADTASLAGCCGRPLLRAFGWSRCRVHP